MASGPRAPERDGPSICASKRTRRGRFEQHRAIVIGRGRRNAQRDQLLAGLFQFLSNGVGRRQLARDGGDRRREIVQGHAVVRFGFQAGFDGRQAVIRADLGAFGVEQISRGVNQVVSDARAVQLRELRASAAETVLASCSQFRVVQSGVVQRIDRHGGLGAEKNRECSAPSPGAT